MYTSRIQNHFTMCFLISVEVTGRASLVVGVARLVANVVRIIVSRVSLLI